MSNRCSPNTLQVYYTLHKSKLLQNEELSEERKQAEAQLRLPLLKLELRFTSIKYY